MKTFILDDWGRVEHVFKENDSPLPNKLNSIIVATEDDEGKIVSFVVLQYVPHAEPIWIAPEYRGKLDIKPMIDVIDSLIDGEPGSQYFAFAPNAGIERMTKKMGLEQMPWTVWRKTF